MQECMICSSNTFLPMWKTFYTNILFNIEPCQFNWTQFPIGAEWCIRDCKKHMHQKTFMQIDIEKTCLLHSSMLPHKHEVSNDASTQSHIPCLMPPSALTSKGQRLVGTWNPKDEGWEGNKVERRCLFFIPRSVNIYGVIRNLSPINNGDGDLGR